MLLIGYLYKSTAFKHTVTLVGIDNDGLVTVWYHDRLYCDAAARLTPTGKQNKNVTIEKTLYGVVIKQGVRK